MNPVAMENSGEKHDTARGKPYRAIANRHLALSTKRTGTQRKTKVSHDMYIVHTAVGEKACLGTKQRQTVKKNQARSLIHC